MQSLYFLSYFLNFLFTFLLSFFSRPRYIHFAILQFTWLQTNALYITLVVQVRNSVCMKSYMLYVTASTYVCLPSYKYSHLVKLLLVRYSNACLRLFVVILQDLQCTLDISQH